MAVFIVELGLAMGYTPCSNIAQMIGDAIIWLFDKMMDAAEAGVELGAALRDIMSWRAERHGARHGRPWSSRIYTDDAAHVILGVAQMMIGVFLKGVNAIYFHRKFGRPGTWNLDLWFEAVPQFIFMASQLCNDHAGGDGWRDGGMA